MPVPETNMTQSSSEFHDICQLDHSFATFFDRIDIGMLMDFKKSVSIFHAKNNSIKRIGTESPSMKMDLF